MLDIYEVYIKDENGKCIDVEKCSIAAIYASLKMTKRALLFWLLSFIVILLITGAYVGLCFVPFVEWLHVLFVGVGILVSVFVVAFIYAYWIHFLVLLIHYFDCRIVLEDRLGKRWKEVIYDEDIVS